MRKQLKVERQREVEDHVKAVSAILEEAQAANSDEDEEINAEDFEEWDGIEEAPNKQADVVDYEDEYIDEDRYTTVKVEAISVTRDGLEKLHQDSDEAEADSQDESKAEKRVADDKATRTKVRKEWPKKKKFRYETKLERSLGAKKAKAKKKAKFKKD
ncbi:hypothetical protein LZ32DRAFT_608574 [Colletotrichum eremochloae]|nr:hypothetical protein LZ32DRAFT_608574 [Colletotrichum eremochloae]